MNKTPKNMKWITMDKITDFLNDNEIKFGIDYDNACITIPLTVSRQWEESVVRKAKSDFNALIKWKSYNQLKELVPACWITAMRWAKWYTKSHEHPEYKEIYNLWYDYFSNLDNQKEFSKKQMCDFAFWYHNWLLNSKRKDPEEELENFLKL